MKNLILLDHYYSPSELEERTREGKELYNNSSVFINKGGRS
jgi:hypothetical protein